MAAETTPMRRGLDEGSAALSSWDPERVRAPIAATDFMESRRLRREGVDIRSEMRRRVAWELSCVFERGGVYCGFHKSIIER